MGSKKKLLLLLFAAFMVRVISLNQSLWLDEGITARVVREYSYQQIVTVFAPSDFHPPLYYLFIKVWTSIFGLSEIALRMPSVLFSLFTGWIIYKISKNSLWTTAFFLFNPLIIYYSQEARMYSMVTLFLTLAWYAFMNKKNLLFNIFIGLSFLTFYGSIFFIASIYIYLTVKKEYTRLLRLLPGFLMAIMVVSPLLFHQWQNSREALAVAVNWNSVLGTATVKNFVLIPLKFVTGRLSFEPKILYYSLGGILMISSFAAAAVGTAKRKLYGFLFLIPLFLATIFSLFTPLLQYFRFLYLIPILSVLIYIGTTKTWQRAVIFLGFLGFSVLYLFFPQFHREDWKSLSSFTTSSDYPVYMIHSSSDALRYYTEKEVKELRTLSTQKAMTKRVIIIPYTADIYGYDYASQLQKQRYSLQKKESFRELTAEVWSR